MNAADPVVVRLIAWTPFLASGFLWNIAIALTALAIGTACGALLARLRASPRRARARAGRTATALLRGIPTFVFQFYLAFVLPDTLTLPTLGLHVPLPAWLKAALALSLAVAAFVSDSLARRQALPALVSDWGSFGVTIVMASSTASVPVRDGGLLPVLLVGDRGDRRALTRARPARPQLIRDSPRLPAFG